MTRYLGLLETGGNQRFIFATNKLRENVGASELTFLAGSDWVRAAVESVPGTGTEIILATSGKAYFVAGSEDAARTVIRTVTTRALKEAPGLDLSGVFVPIDGDKFDAAIKAAHKKLAERRGTNPGPEARFRRLPVVAECATSGMPAAEYENSKREPGPRSAQSKAKRKKSGDGIDRMRKIARKHAGLGIVSSIADLETVLDDLDDVAKRSWLAVVHADGNGLGKVFLKFGDHVPNGEDYITALKTFSRALDDCTYQAFGFALKNLHARTGLDPLPVVPIVLGGDDMTVVMDGKYAVQFSIDFLAEFERLTAGHDYIPKVMRGKDGKGENRVTACAGVAVIKSHFPFYAAYELAEELIKSAKTFAKPDSGLDFHILYDASGADLERIRESLTLDNDVTKLVARPYLVSKDEGPRTTATLDRLMHVVRQKEDGRRAIPNSQLHDLREALFLGSGPASARYELVKQRYDAFAALLPDGLFWKDRDVQRTHLLDAIDLVEFWHTTEDAR